jgi:heat shock protein HslJ
MEQLKAATVSGIFDQAITLADGKYEGPPVEEGAASRPTAMLWETAVKFGDVDGAQGSEAVAMLSSNSGGSGEFVYVSVLGIRDGKAVNLGTAPVGDRAKLNSLWLEQGKIKMDVVEAGPKDAACCPTQVARKTYGMQGGKLEQLSSEVVGVLSMNMLGGAEWMLTSIDQQPLPEGAKAPTLRLEYGKISGFAGCNRYNAPIAETAPGQITIGAAATTKMACEPPQSQIEQQYLARLANAKSFTFLAGQLAITTDEKGTPGLLVFAK